MNDTRKPSISEDKSFRRFERFGGFYSYIGSNILKLFLLRNFFQFGSIGEGLE